MLFKIVSKLTEATYTSYTSVGGGNEGLIIVEMALSFCQGTTTTHVTHQLSQSLFDSEITEISARNETPIQSLLKIPIRNDVSGY